MTCTKREEASAKKINLSLFEYGHVVPDDEKREF